jgi:hypothetical protein
VTRFALRLALVLLGLRSLFFRIVLFRAAWLCRCLISQFVCYLLFGSFLLFLIAHFESAMMNYNALQATLRQHLNRGLEFTLNYTYSKAMTNSLGMYFLNVVPWATT